MGNVSNKLLKSNKLVDSTSENHETKQVLSKVGPPTNSLCWYIINDLVAEQTTNVTLFLDPQKRDLYKIIKEILSIELEYLHMTIKLREIAYDVLRKRIPFINDDLMCQKFTDEYVGIM